MEEKKDMPKQEVILEKEDVKEKEDEKKEEEIKLVTLDDVLSGNQSLKITQKENENEAKIELIEDKKETQENIGFKSLYLDKIEDDTNVKPVLSDILNPVNDEKKEDKKEEKELKGLKKFKTDSTLATKGTGSSLRDKMSKRLQMAKNKAKKKEDENKFRKSDIITMTAHLLENKLSFNNTNNDNKQFEKIHEVNEDEKDS